MKLIQFKKNTFPKKGFTLIETLVAISILLLSIIGPMEIAARGLFSAYYARDEITAYYLAQEGVEYIRNIRDTKYLEDFKAGTLVEGAEDGKWVKIDVLGPCFRPATENACLIDATVDPSDVSSNPVIACKLNTGSDSCTGPSKYLKYNNETWTYSYATGPKNKPTKFHRFITIDLLPNQQGDQEALITSTVQWTTGSLLGTTRKFEIKERLINWQR